MPGMRTPALLPHPRSARATASLSNVILCLFRLFHDVHRPVPIHTKRKAERGKLRIIELRPGGHSHTVTVDYDGENIPVDTGFIVYNEPNYPNLTALFRHLGVETYASDMSFGLTTARMKPATPCSAARRRSQPDGCSRRRLTGRHAVSTPPRTANFQATTSEENCLFASSLCGVRLSEAHSRSSPRKRPTSCLAGSERTTWGRGSRP